MLDMDLGKDPRGERPRMVVGTARPPSNLLGWAKEDAPVRVGVPGACFTTAPSKKGMVSSLEESPPPPHKGKGRLRAPRAAQAEIKPEALPLAVAGVKGCRFSCVSF